MDNKNEKNTKWIPFFAVALLLLCVCILLIFDITLRLSGKNGNLQEGDNADAGLPEESSETIVFKLASTLSTDMDALNELSIMSEEVYEETGGRLDIQIYDSSRLGDQSDYVNGVKIGTVEMCLASTAGIEALDPHFVIFAVPGLFKSPESVNAFYNNSICKNMLENFRNENGVRVLGLYHDGIRNVWLKNKEIHKASDFKGLRLRVPDVEIRKKEFSSLGAETVTMALGDCYVGLQSGYIDGLENNVATILSSNIHEQIGYQVKTEHAYSTLLLLINEDAYNSLDKETKSILDKNIQKCNFRAFDDYTKEQDEAYKLAEAKGIETIELEEEERKTIDSILLESCKPMLEGLFPDDIYELIRAL